MNQRVRVHLRVAKNHHGRTAFKVAADAKPNYRPLTKGSGLSERPLPTVMFAVDFIVSGDAFKQAEKVVAEVEVPDDLLVVAAEVRTEVES